MEGIGLRGAGIRIHPESEKVVASELAVLAGPLAGKAC